MPPKASRGNKMGKMSAFALVIISLSIFGVASESIAAGKCARSDNKCKQCESTCRGANVGCLMHCVQVGDCSKCTDELKRCLDRCDK